MLKALFRRMTTSPRGDLAADGPPGAVTRLLADLSAGDPSAAERLIPLVYPELHAIAERCLYGERADHTLQPTALVNEAYLKLVDQTRVSWQSRAHFLGVAARLMRRILVDYARSHRAQKRGGASTRVAFDDSCLPPRSRDVDLVALDDALHDLARKDPDAARLVELKFFAGLTTAETAEVLGVSGSTVEREWAAARAWLYRAMTEGVLT